MIMIIITALAGDDFVMQQQWVKVQKLAVKKWWSKLLFPRIGTYTKGYCNKLDQSNFKLYVKQEQTFVTIVWHSDLLFCKV